MTAITSIQAREILDSRGRRPSAQRQPSQPRPPASRNDVAVEIEGDADLAVAQAFACDLRADADRGIGCVGWSPSSVDPIAAWIGDWRLILTWRKLGCLAVG